MRLSKSLARHTQYQTLLTPIRNLSRIEFTERNIVGLEEGQYINDDIVVFYQQYVTYQIYLEKF